MSDGGAVPRQQTDADMFRARARVYIMFLWATGQGRETPVDTTSLIATGLLELCARPRSGQVCAGDGVVCGESSANEFRT